jgi:hypothetical protein
MTNRDKGKKLEELVAEKLSVALKDPSIRPTKASSGGSHNTEIGDLLSSQFYVECKSHKGKFFNRKTWVKLIDSLPFGTTKIPLYVIQDDIEGIMIALTFTDFINLIKKEK